MFIAGIEGTGHHAFSSMMVECSRIDSISCMRAKGLSVSLFNHNKDENYGLFSAEHGLEITEDIALVHREFRRISMKFNKTNPTLYYIGLISDNISGMLSYPNFAGVFKAVNHPDVVILTKTSSDYNEYNETKEFTYYAANLQSRLNLIQELCNQK